MCLNKQRVIDYLVENEKMTEAEAIAKYDSLREQGYSSSEARKQITGIMDYARPEIQKKKWKEYTGKDPTGEIHYGVPEEFSEWFRKRGIDVNDGKYYYDLSKGKHRLISDNGVHTNSSAHGKTWNKVWEEWIDLHDNATAEDIMKQLQIMAEKEGIKKYAAVKKG